MKTMTTEVDGVIKKMHRLVDIGTRHTVDTGSEMLCCHFLVRKCGRTSSTVLNIMQSAAWVDEHHHQINSEYLEHLCKQDFHSSLGDMAWAYVLSSINGWLVVKVGGWRKSKTTGFLVAYHKQKGIEKQQLPGLFKIYLVQTCGCFQKIGVPQYGWFLIENPMNKWDDLGGCKNPYFWFNSHVGVIIYIEHLKEGTWRNSYQGNTNTSRYPLTWQLGTGAGYGLCYRFPCMALDGDHSISCSWPTTRGAGRKSNINQVRKPWRTWSQHDLKLDPGKISEKAIGWKLWRNRNLLLHFETSDLRYTPGAFLVEVKPGPFFRNIFDFRWLHTSPQCFRSLQPFRWNGGCFHH